MNQEDNNVNVPSLPRVTKPNVIVSAPPRPTQATGYLQLPIDQKGLATFIRSLLGSPQSLSKDFVKPFEVIRDDIFNLNALITQRVAQQNAGDLIGFSAKIIYDDDSSVELQTIDEFMSFRMTRPVVTTALHLKWDFIIRFTDKDHPENQKILISFISRGSVLLDKPFNSPGSYGRVAEGGVINYRIEYTARSWGADIDSLLNNHINAMFVQQTKFKDFCVAYSEKLGWACALASLAFYAGSVFLASRVFAARNIHIVHNLLRYEGKPEGAIGHKIDALSSYVASGYWPQFASGTLFFLFVALVASVILGIWAESIASKRPGSHILLTDASEANKIKQRHLQERSGWNFVFYVVIAILINIFSSWVFLWLCKTR